MFFLIIAVFCVSSINLGFTIAKHRQMNNLNVTLFNYLAAALIGAMLLFQADISPQRLSLSSAWGNFSGSLTPEGSYSFSILFGVAVGFLYIFSLLLTQQSIKTKGTSLTTMFQRTGIVIPILTSAILWNEIPTTLQIIGIISALFSLVYMNHEGKGIKLSGLLLAVFITGGVCELSNKLYQMYALEQHKPVFLSAIFTTCVVLCVIYIYTGKRRAPLRLQEAILGTAIGLPNIFSAYFIIKALEQLPTSIVFPVLSVGTILLITLVSSLAFGEKISPKNRLAIAVFLISIVLVNI